MSAPRTSPIFHVALAADWESAQQAGEYTMSTRGRTLADEGFIHASRGDQWPRTHQRFYADVAEPLVLLKIDTARLDVPVIDEPGEPGGAETFPHIYGPLPVRAVVQAIPLDASPAAPRTQPTIRNVSENDLELDGEQPGDRPPGGFASAYFTEMFVNAGLICLAMVAAMLGVTLGYAFGEIGGGIGGVGGLLLGAAVARWLYVRRHDSTRAEAR